jgi:hypothetical protein
VVLIKIRIYGQPEPVVGGMSLTVGDFRPLWKAGLGFKIQGYGDTAGFNPTTNTIKETEK